MVSNFETHRIMESIFSAKPIKLILVEGQSIFSIHINYDSQYENFAYNHCFMCSLNAETGDGGKDEILYRGLHCI